MSLDELRLYEAAFRLDLSSSVLPNVDKESSPLLFRAFQEGALRGEDFDVNSFIVFRNAIETFLLKRKFENSNSNPLGFVYKLVTAKPNGDSLLAPANMPYETFKIFRDELAAGYAAYDSWPKKQSPEDLTMKQLRDGGFFPTLTAGSQNNLRKKNSEYLKSQDGKDFWETDDGKKFLEVREALKVQGDAYWQTEDGKAVKKSRLALAFCVNEDKDKPGLPYLLSEDGFKTILTETSECMLGSTRHSNPLAKTVGFGTDDVGAIVRLMKDCELGMKDLTTPEGVIRFYVLQDLAKLHDFRLDGLREWAERVTGKKIKDIGFADVGSLIRQFEKRQLQDPLVLDARNTTVSADSVRCANLLTGRIAIGDAKLTPQEATGLLQALRTFSSENRTQNVSLCGVPVKLECSPDTRSLTAWFSMKEGADPIPVHVSADADDLLRQVEDEVTAHTGAYDNQTVWTTVAPYCNITSALSVMRAREVLTRTISSLSGVNAIDLSSHGMEKLVGFVRQRLVENKNLTREDVVLGTPTTYSSREIIDLHNRFKVAANAERLCVNVSSLANGPGAEGPGGQEGNLTRDVRLLFADLMMNRNVWEFDAPAGNAEDSRTAKILRENANVVERLRTSTDDGLLSGLPETVRRYLGAFIQVLRGAGADWQTNAQVLTALDTQLNEAVNNAMKDIQKDVSALFKATHATVGLEDQTLEEVSGASGLDDGTLNGRFVKNVLDSYFTGSDVIEKRAMLASLLRGADSSSSKGLQVAALLKGAGPLLQKMLQGLPIETFGPETQLALKDMKSKLAPIPTEIVQAQLLELIRASGGKILSVDVLKSLGAATVGQAFLCRIRTKERPVNGEVVVIKLLRPNVQTAIRREHDLIANLADKLETDPTGMGKGTRAAFDNQYAGVLTELDFTQEAANIDVGTASYEKPHVLERRPKSQAVGPDQKVEYDYNVTTLNEVRSMRRKPGVAPSTGVLVLERVEGSTIDGFIEDSKAVLNEVPPTKVALSVEGEGERTGYFAGNPGEHAYKLRRFDQVYRQATERRKAVEKLIHGWIEEALFGGGFFHCDLHAGNVMSSGRNATVIDYGNAMRLSADEQRKMVLMLANCMRGNVDELFASLVAQLPEAERDKWKTSFFGNSQPGDQLKEKLKIVLSKGTSSNVVERFLGVLTVMQRAGMPVPKGVCAFVQSATRLKGVLTSLDDLRQETLAAQKRLELRPGAFPDNATVSSIPFLSNLDKRIRAVTENGVTLDSSRMPPQSEDILDDLPKDDPNPLFNSDGSVNQAKFDEIRDHFNIPKVVEKNDKDTLDPQRFCTDKDPLTKRFADAIADYKKNTANVGQWRKGWPQRKKCGDWTNDECRLEMRRQLLEKIKQAIIDVVRSFESDLGKLSVNAKPWESEGDDSFESLFADRFCAHSKIDMNGVSLGNVGQRCMEGGKVMQYAWTELQGKFIPAASLQKLGNDLFDCIEEVQARKKNFADLRKWMDDNNHVKNLGWEVCSQIVKAAALFVIPSTGIPSDAKGLREMFGKNIERLRQKLVGANLVKTLSDECLKVYAAALTEYFGAKLNEKVGELDQKTYDKLVNPVVNVGNVQTVTEIGVLVEGLKG